MPSAYGMRGKMKNSQEQSDVQALIEAKRLEHGHTWELCGRIWALMISYARTHPEIVGKYWVPIFMVVFKACRALNNPHNSENWKDIQGYAQLVLEDLDEGKNVSSK